MKRIINGKAYDTTTARLVGEWYNGRGVTDFDYCEEKLYCKRTGEYFIHGVGGAMSRYAKAAGQSSWTGGERIMPVSYEQAQAWAESNLDADTYENEFGVVDESAGDADLHVVISAAAYDRIRRTAAQDGTTVRAVIERLAATL